MRLHRPLIIRLLKLPIGYFIIGAEARLYIGIDRKVTIGGILEN
jgi:hypothetical protein